MKKSHLFSEPYKAAFSLFLKEKINEGTGSKVKDVYQITELWDNVSEEEKIRYDYKAKELMKQQLESMKKSPIKPFEEITEEPVEESSQPPRRMKRLAYARDSETKEEVHEEEEEPVKEESEKKPIEKPTKYKPKDVIKDQLDRDVEYLLKVAKERKAQQLSKPKIRIEDFDNPKRDKQESKNDKFESREYKSEKNKKYQPDSDEELRVVLTDMKQIKQKAKQVTKEQSSDEDDIEMSRQMKQAEKRYSKKREVTRKENDVLVVKESLESLIKHFQKFSIK